MVQRDALHPCWKEAHFLPCTRPPDFMRLHRPQRGRIHHGPSELHAFVSTLSGLQTMPTGGHGDDTPPAALTGAAAGPVRRFTPPAPPRQRSPPLPRMRARWHRFQGACQGCSITPPGAGRGQKGEGVAGSGAARGAGGRRGSAPSPRANAPPPLPRMHLESRLANP